MKEKHFIADGVDFIRKQFHSLLLSATMTVAIAVILQVSDIVIGGQVFGENAVSAINLVTPLITMVFFLGSLLPVGTGIMYNYEIGQKDKERAYQFSGQALALSCAIGILACLTSFLGEELYLSAIGTSELLNEYVRAYYKWYRFVFLIFPIFNIFSELVYADGDEIISNISNIVLFVGNISISLFSVFKIGFSGVGLGSFLSYTLATGILILHFFKKNNSIHFKWHISFPDLVKVIKFSIVDSGQFLFYSIAFYFLNILVISGFGEKYLSIATLITTIIEMEIIFQGAGMAITPLISIYRGEKNSNGIKRVLKYGFIAEITEGLIVSAILFVFAGQIPALVGITSPDLVSASSLALRILALGLVFMALVYLYTSYCIVIEKIFLAVLLTFLANLGIFVPLAFLFEKIAGLPGIWIDIGFAPALSCAVIALFIRLRYGKKHFPYLIDESTYDEYSYDIKLTQDNIIKLRDWCGDVLSRYDTDQKVINRVMLIIEETYMLALQKNKKQISAETSLYIDDDNIQLLLRHDGEIFDSTNDNADIDSFATFFVSCIMEKQKKRAFFITTGYNRVIFEFSRHGQASETSLPKQ